MKFTVSIFLTLIQFGLLGQPSEWSLGTITRNKVKEVLVYTKVPETNPDYYKEPKGLMLISETTFDKLGRVTQYNCKNCYVVSDTDDSCCADVIQKFFYDQGKLVRIEEMDFHKSTLLFSYDNTNHRRLVIGLNRNDKRIKAKLEYFDEKGKEITAMEFDFENAFTKGDTIYQVFVNKVVSTYDKTTRTNERFRASFWDTMNKMKFQVFNTSTDFNEIENTFKSLDLGFLESQGKWTIYYDENGNEIRIGDSYPTTYIRSENGLINKMVEKKGVYTFEYVYQYRFWN